jgi:hypothetical protein
MRESFAVSNSADLPIVVTTWQVTTRGKRAR